MKTFNAKAETVQRDWYVVDAEGVTLGRLAAEVAFRLRGKHKPEFTANTDAGDYIVVLNADKIRVTGNKAKGKIYYHHTGAIGGLKGIPFEKLHAEKPAYVIERAVKGMLPRTPMGRQMFSKLKVYVGTEHPHVAQQPKVWKIEG